MNHKLFFAVAMLPSLIHAQATVKPAITQPIPVKELIAFQNNSNHVKDLILKASALSKDNLTYLYGSADPKNKGMDCSGTIYYLLNSENIKNVPRSSDEMYQWVKRDGYFHQVTQNDFNSTEFSQLKPGDLLFWSGTYDDGKPNSITHVMLYLGKTSQNKPLMFGSSDGRSYEHKRMWGVSVFDFELPGKKDSAKFVGYSCIPDFTCNTRQ